jgi:hypothetical protein
MDPPVSIKCGEVSEPTLVLLENWNSVRMVFDSLHPRCRRRLAFRVHCAGSLRISSVPEDDGCRC